jgi:hypothetical protein
MTKRFSPCLDILPAPQRRLWGELSSVPKEFLLYGGTAVALHLGHRDSLDFDFFGDRPIEAERLQAAMPFLVTATLTREAPNTLDYSINRGGDIKLSFFGTPRLPRLRPPVVSPDNGLQIASLLDLAATKVAVVQKRAEAKDYIDIAAIIGAGGIDLPTALAAGKAVYGMQFNPQNALKALCYFGDGNLSRLPQEVKDRFATLVAAVDLNRLPVVAARRPIVRRKGLDP